MPFPDVKDYYGLLNYLGGKDKHDALVATFGHDLKYILPQFDPESGKPEKYEQVIKWPSITHKEYGHSSESLASKFGKATINNLDFITRVKAQVGIKIAESVSSRIFGYEATSLSTLVYLAIDLASGKMSQYQFWEVHKHLNKTDGYGVIGNIHSLETFDLLYKGQYHCDPADDYYFMIRGGFDKYFRIIKENVHRVELNSQIGINGDFIQKLQSFAKVYEYNQLTDSIMAIDKHKVANGISYLRDEIRKFLHYHEPAMSYIAILKPENGFMPEEVSLAHKLEDIKDLADSLSPNYILYESNNSKYITKAKKLCDDKEVSAYVLSPNVQLQELLNYVWLEYSIANSYMADHKGKQARDILLKLINNLKQYVLNQNPHLKSEVMDNNFKLMQEFKNDGMKVMLIKAVYSLGRTFFYIKDNVQESKSYLESVGKLAQVKVEGNKDLQDLFEVHLSKANALGIIIREEAEKYILLGDIAKAVQKLNKALKLYQNCINDNTKYKLDYDHHMQYDREIIPSKNAYALAECYEQMAKCYLDQSKMNSDYIKEALNSIIETQNPEFGYNVKLKELPAKKVSSLLNTLSDILLTGFNTLNFEEIKEQLLQWLNFGNLKQELQDNIKKTTSMLTLTKAIAYISKDISREIDHTKADACKIIIEIVNQQINNSNNNYLSVEQLNILQQELESNKQELQDISQALEREHSNILQHININSRCQNIESIIENHFLENSSIKSKAEYAGEELELSSKLDGQTLCIKKILEMDFVKQIPIKYLGESLVNVAAKGYVSYIMMMNNKNITNTIPESYKSDALTTVIENIGACVKYCVNKTKEPGEYCKYILPSSILAQAKHWVVRGADKVFEACTKVSPLNKLDIEGSGHYLEVAATLVEEIQPYNHIHDEL